MAACSWRGMPSNDSSAGDRLNLQPRWGRVRRVWVGQDGGAAQKPGLIDSRRIEQLGRDFSRRSGGRRIAIHLRSDGRPVVEKHQLAT